MSWPEYDAALAESRPEPPFCTGAERDEWQDRNCTTCVHDAEQRGAALPSGPGCPLLNVVLLAERTPAPWIAPDNPRDLHRCISYRHEDDGPPEPVPVPDPPGQLVLGPREPLEGVRMLTALDPLDQVLAEHRLTDGPPR